MLQPAQRELLVTYDFRAYWTLSLIEKRDTNLTMLKTTLILVSSLQNWLKNFCHFVFQKNFYLKGSLKYRIFSLALHDSVSVGMIMVFLFIK